MVMRRIRYRVACSMDGYIADADGRFDWIVQDPDMNFAALFDEFDTFLMGRRTFEMIPPGDTSLINKNVVVVSATLRPEDHPGVRIVADDLESVLIELRARPGRDIWLFGGAQLFRTAWNLGQIDSVETAIIPIMLGSGLPLLPPPAERRQLELRNHRIFDSGIVLLEYDVQTRARKGS